MKGELERKVSTLDATNVSLLGHMDDDAVTEAFLDHDVIALPSVNRLEAFGITLIEGMAAGCVPVASSLPGLADTVGTNGLLAKHGSSDDLRWALELLAEDPDLVRRFQQRAPGEAARFNWDKTVDEYEALFQGVVATRSDRRRLSL